MATDVIARGMAMKMPGLAPALAALGNVSAPSFLRVHPISATEAYVIAPHSTLGALAFRFVKANGGDVSTPSSSVGTPFGGWRLWGIRQLRKVEDDPATNYKQFVSDDIGSQHFAIQLASNSIYAGVYHGGLTHNSQIFTSMADLTVAAYIPAFVFYSTFTLDWGSGNVMTGTDKWTIFPDGHLETETYIAGGLEFSRVYLDMTIGESWFDRAKAPGEAQFTKLLSNTDGSSDTDYLWSNSDTVVLRDRAAGIEMTITDDTRAHPNYDSKWVRRSPLGGSMRSKVYARLKSATGIALPPATVKRSVSFARNTPDTFSWNATTDVYDGIGKASGIGLPTVSGGAAHFVRSATVQFRAKWRVGVVPGATYRIPVSTVLAGGGASSGSNGMTYVVTYDGIDSIQTPTPLVSRSYAQVVTDGYLEFTAPANATVVQVIVQQTTGTAGHAVDVSSLGPIVRTA